MYGLKPVPFNGSNAIALTCQASERPNSRHPMRPFPSKRELTLKSLNATHKGRRKSKLSHRNNAPRIAVRKKRMIAGMCCAASSLGRDFYAWQFGFAGYGKTQLCH